ncbi:hypothetical protein D3C81_1090800 [compost metagenome]
MLTIDVFQFGVVILRSQAIVDLVVEAVHVEMVGGGVAGVALVLAVHADVLRIGGIARGVLVQARGHEGQVFQLFRGEHGAIEHGRQQTSVVVFQQRQIRQQRAVLQHRVRDLDLGG